MLTRRRTQLNNGRRTTGAGMFRNFWLRTKALRGDEFGRRGQVSRNQARRRHRQHVASLRRTGRIWPIYGIAKPANPVNRTAPVVQTVKYCSACINWPISSAQQPCAACLAAQGAPYYAEREAA